VTFVRQYRPGDFERLYKLDQACFEPALAYSRTELRFYIRHPATFTLVAEPEDAPAEIVGFVVGHRRRGAVGHIITLDVDSNARRQGIGTLLMDTAEQRLAQSGCNAVTLETAVDNRPGISFYLRRDYSLVRTVRGYYANGVDALEMQKELASKK